MHDKLICHFFISPCWLDEGICLVGNTTNSQCFQGNRFCSTIFVSAFVESKPVFDIFFGFACKLSGDSKLRDRFCDQRFCVRLTCYLVEIFRWIRSGGRWKDTNMGCGGSTDKSSASNGNGQAVVSPTYDRRPKISVRIGNAVKILDNLPRIIFIFGKYG